MYCPLLISNIKNIYKIIILIIFTIQNWIHFCKKFLKEFVKNLFDCFDFELELSIHFHFLKSFLFLPKRSRQAECSLQLKRNKFKNKSNLQNTLVKENSWIYGREKQINSKMDPEFERRLSKPSGCIRALSNGIIASPLSPNSTPKKGTISSPNTPLSSVSFSKNVNFDDIWC